MGGESDDERVIPSSGGEVEGSKSRRVKILGWILILLTPIIIFTAVEVAVRVLDLHPRQGPEAAIPAWLDRNILVKESAWIQLLTDSPTDLSNYYKTYQWDRYLFYKLRAHLDLPLTDVAAPAAIRDRTRWVFHTNSRGFNSPEIPYQKPAGTFRVVALGDSSTFGWGVGAEENYPRLLESELERRNPRATIEVVNLGVCGYSSLQGRILLQREALRYHPDVMTLSYGSNDFSRVPEAFDILYARNLGGRGALQALMHHSRAYQMYAAFLRGAVKKLRGSPDSNRSPDGTEGVLNVGPEKSLDNLEEMVHICRQHAIEPIFVTNCVRGELGEPIHSAAARTSTPILDAEALLDASIENVLDGSRYREQFARYRGLYGPKLIEKFPWLSVYLVDRCHPNTIGHRLIAESLALRIEATPSFESYKRSFR